MQHILSFRSSSDNCKRWFVQAIHRYKMQTPQDFFCICGELTYDVYCKKLNGKGRRTHHLPKKHSCGNYTDLTKVCPKCKARYSICKIHKRSGFQQWKLTERSSKNCTAKMWTYSCKKCDPQAVLSTVLCPGCKVCLDSCPYFYHDIKYTCSSKVFPTQWYSSYLSHQCLCLFCRPHLQIKGRNGTWP